MWVVGIIIIGNILGNDVIIVIVNRLVVYVDINLIIIVFGVYGNMVGIFSVGCEFGIYFFEMIINVVVILVKNIWIFDINIDIFVINVNVFISGKIN